MTRCLEVVGKLVAGVILVTVVAGLVVLTLALVGCTP